MLGCKGLKSNFQISVEGKPGLLCCFCFFFYYFALSLVQKTRAAKLKPITTWSLAFSRALGIWVVFFFFEILLALDGTFLSSDWPLISGFVFTTLNQKAPLYRKLVIFGLRITGNELFSFTLQQSISMSEWSNILACGDAAGEVVAVHVLPKKRKTFARFVRMSGKLLDV